MKSDHEKPLVHASMKNFINALIHSPDGIATAVLSVMFFLMGAFPSIFNQLGRIFHFEFTKGSTPYSFLFIPPMILISYIWLNAFTKTSKIGAYINALMIIVFTLLLVLGSVNYL